MERKCLTMEHKDFGSYLKYLRELRGLTITQLSRDSEVSPSYISRLENGGRRPPKPDILKKFAPFLGIGYNELMIKAGYLTTNNEDLRIEDSETKELFVALTEGKKELLRAVDGMSEETILLITQMVRKIKEEVREELAIDAETASASLSSDEQPNE